MKRLVCELTGEIPHLRSSLLHAMANVQPRHLLDPASPAAKPRQEMNRESGRSG